MVGAVDANIERIALLVEGISARFASPNHECLPETLLQSPFVTNRERTHSLDERIPAHERASIF